MNVFLAVFGIVTVVLAVVGYIAPRTLSAKQPPRVLLLVLLPGMLGMAMMLNTMVFPYFPVIAKESHLNNEMIGAALSAAYLSPAILTPIGTALIPRLGHSALMVICLAACIVSSIGFAFAHRFLDGMALGSLYFIFRGLIGTGAEMFYILAASLLSVLFPESLGNINGLVLCCENLGNSFGPIISSSIYQSAGFEPAVLLPTFGVLALTGLVVGSSSRVSLKHDEGSNGALMTHGILDVFKRLDLVLILYLVFLSAFVWGFCASTQEIELELFLGEASRRRAVLEATILVATMAGSLSLFSVAAGFLSQPDQIGAKRLTLYGVLLQCVSLPILVLPAWFGLSPGGHFMCLLIGEILFAAANRFGRIPATVALLELSQWGAAHIDLFISLSNVAFVFGVGLGEMFGPVSVQQVGHTGMIHILTIATLVAVVPSWLSLRH